MPGGDVIADRPEGREPLRNGSTGSQATEARREGGADAADDAHCYWLRRERTACALAARAVDQHIARIHLDMAERYAVLADGAHVAKPPK